MQSRLQKWGNSDGIRIPSNILKSLNLKTNDVIELVQEGDKIIISIPKKQKISLEERFKNYKGPNLCKEFSWDGPVGREIW